MKVLNGVYALVALSVLVCTVLVATNIHPPETAGDAFLRHELERFGASPARKHLLSTTRSPTDALDVPYMHVLAQSLHETMKMEASSGENRIGGLVGAGAGAGASALSSGSGSDAATAEMAAELRSTLNDVHAMQMALHEKMANVEKMASSSSSSSSGSGSNKVAWPVEGLNMLDGVYPVQDVDDAELQKRIYFLSCMGVDEYDRQLLARHIIKYFEAMGVLKSNFVLIIQARYNLTGIKDMWQWLDAEGIEPADVWVGPYSSTDLHEHRLRVLEPLSLTKDDWIVHADQDDFHEYPMPLVRFLGEMNEGAVDVVKGKFVDHFATRDCRALPTVSLDSSVFDQFPHCSANFTKKLVGGNPKKVVLYRGNLRTNRGGHKITNLDGDIVSLVRDPDRSSPVEARALNMYGGGPLVHHFKWSSSVLDRLIDRKVRYKLRDGHNGTHWREAGRAIAFFTRDYEELADEDLGDHSFSWASAGSEVCADLVEERRDLTNKAIRVMKESQADLEDNVDNDDEEEEEEKKKKKKSSGRL